jgi:hypothetical protein
VKIRYYEGIPINASIRSLDLFEISSLVKFFIMKEQIEILIKQEIKLRLVGNYYTYKGQQKLIKRFVNWWNGSIGFDPDIDLATVAVRGSEQTNYSFHAWVMLDVDGNQAKQIDIDANFGPITITFDGTRYQTDCSNASFTRFELG